MIVTLPVDQESHTVMSGSGVAVTSSLKLVIATEIQEKPGSEKVSVSLGKIRASIVIISFNIYE
jgi:hypothetical protein